jgi:hypothetical protein
LLLLLLELRLHALFHTAVLRLHFGQELFREHQLGAFLIHFLRPLLLFFGLQGLHIFQGALIAFEQIFLLLYRCHQSLLLTLVLFLSLLPRLFGLLQALHFGLQFLYSIIRIESIGTFLLLPLLLRFGQGLLLVGQLLLQFLLQLKESNVGLR